MPEKSPPPASIFGSLARAVADAKTPWAVVAILGLALILSACAVDRERVAKTREDLQLLCEGAITSTLRAACERAGISTAGATVTTE